MKFEKTEVWGFEHAIRGMRNPLESWDKSDSDYIIEDECRTFFIGENDLILAQKLIKAGSEHRKFLRQIFVATDITAPLYWWKEFDTYKVGTVANSTSTMHKLASTPITKDCFEMDDFEDCKDDSNVYVSAIWAEGITRTVTMNYENLLNMYHHRKNHKLTEWHKFCEWVESLPYAGELIIGTK